MNDYRPAKQSYRVTFDDIAGAAALFVAMILLVLLPWII
jgi:hypothetical protein